MASGADNRPANVGSAPMGTVEALRRLAACRDDDAWSAILLKHGRGILRLAERIGGAALADDACQETLLQIRAHAAQFSLPPGVRDAEGAARGWVMCIAYRTAVGMLRLDQRRGHNERLAALRREHAAGAPDEALLSGEQLEQVRREVGRLPELLRGAVCLHYYGELSYGDLSSALACSQDVARKRVERGLSELRGRLAAAGLAVGLAALSSVLSGTGGTVAAVSGGGAGAAVALKQFTAWQALLHSTHGPALAGVVKWGGLAIMSKYIVGTAALLALTLSGVQTWRMSVLSNEVSALSEKADSAAPLQQKVDTLERQLGETRGDAAALKANLALRNEELAQIEKTLKSQGRLGADVGVDAFFDLAAANANLDARKRVANLVEQKQFDAFAADAKQQKEQKDAQALHAYRSALIEWQAAAKNPDQAQQYKSALMEWQAAAKNPDQAKLADLKAEIDALDAQQKAGADQKATATAAEVKAAQDALAAQQKDLAAEKDAEKLAVEKERLAALAAENALQEAQVKADRAQQEVQVQAEQKALTDQKVAEKLAADQALKIERLNALRAQQELQLQAETERRRAEEMRRAKEAELRGREAQYRTQMEQQLRDKALQKNTPVKPPAPPKEQDKNADF